MKYPLLLLTTLLALSTPALAHPGHITEVAGHSHWVSYAIFALLGVLAGFLFISWRNKTPSVKR